MITAFLLLSLVTLLLYAFISTIKPKKFPPGPTWFPFIGSSGVLQNMKKTYGSEWRACLALSKQYATNVIGLKISSELLVVVFGEKYVRQVFNDKAYDSRPHNFFSQLRCLGKRNMAPDIKILEKESLRLLGSPVLDESFAPFIEEQILGITFANGEIWREHRQFAVKNLKHVGYGKTTMEKEIQNELSDILTFIQDNINKPISPEILLSQCIMNVLWKYVAGERIEEKKLKHLLHLFRQRGKAFSVAGGLLNYIPWCRFIIPEWSGYTLITKLNEEINNIIEEAIIKHKKNEIPENDFIYLFLQEMNATKKASFTEEQLKIVCLDLLIAGSQTSSNFLSFALLRAMKSPDVQEKIYSEIDSILGDITPCWSDNERLVYTSAYILEIHRYYSIVPMMGPRLLQEDSVIDGYIIPKGSTVLMSIGDIHHDPELWDEPCVFKPERFIDESGRLKNSEHIYHFGLGRRRCPGDSLAKSFIFITLVGILQNYRIQCNNGTLPSDVPVIGILSTPKPYTAEFAPRKPK